MDKKMKMKTKYEFLGTEQGLNCSIFKNKNKIKYKKIIKESEKHENGREKGLTAEG